MRRTYADEAFVMMLRLALDEPSVVTRNHAARPLFCPPRLVFRAAPGITVRRPAYRLAFKELTWFMSGNPECPPDLRHWWRGQLNPDGQYLLGYGHQLRHAGGEPRGGYGGFDQAASLIDMLRAHPHGRRNRLTTWRADDAVLVTRVNENPNTPTPCHMTGVQFGVSRGTLCAFFEQRSGDLLLGVPHNLMQAWALLTWVAAQVGLPVGRLVWQGVDIHLYDEPSHIACAQEIVDGWERGPVSAWSPNPETASPTLTYRGQVQPTGRAAADAFHDADFSLDWPEHTCRDPLSVIRPALL